MASERGVSQNEGGKLPMKPVINEKSYRAECHAEAWETADENSDVRKKRKGSHHTGAGT